MESPSPTLFEEWVPETCPPNLFPHLEQAPVIWPQLSYDCPTCRCQDATHDHGVCARLEELRVMLVAVLQGLDIDVPTRPASPNDALRAGASST